MIGLVIEVIFFGILLLVLFASFFITICALLPSLNFEVDKGWLQLSVKTGRGSRKE